MQKIRKTLTAVIPGVAFLAFALTAYAAGDTATITITGTVKNASCTLVQPEPVTLPPVDVRDFGGAAGKEVGQATMEIKLNNCTSDQSKLDIQVSGTGSGTVFSNTATDNPAGGVGIEVFDLDGLAFKTDGTSNADVQTREQDGSYDIKYTVKYVSTADTVTAGNVQSIVTVAFTYS
ncbi:fimbrial protein [Pantoea sp. B_10]|nr:fimbrial protein [Pantoea sp. B_10]